MLLSPFPNATILKRTDAVGSQLRARMLSALKPAAIANGMLAPTAKGPLELSAARRQASFHNNPSGTGTIPLRLRVVESLIADYENNHSVVEYCEFYHSTGAITVLERNQLLADFIIRRYKRLLNGPTPNWHQFYYIKTMVWGRVQTDVQLGAVDPNMFKLFSAHMFLCDKLVNSILLHTDAGDVGEALDPVTALEEVCVEWHRRQYEETSSCSLE